VPDRSIARPYRPLLYGPVAWFFDIRAACADARAGIPAAEYIDAGPVLTPTVQQRAQTLADRAEREFLQVQADTAPMRERQAQLRSRIEDLKELVEEQRSVLVGLPERLPEADLERRSAGEVDTPVEGVRTRRTREHDGRRRAVSDRLGALRGDLAAALARLDEAVRGREERGAIRARRLHAYTLRRIASYESRLVRRHPAGRRLAGRLVVVRPAVPGWAQLPAADERALTPIEGARP